MPKSQDTAVKQLRDHTPAWAKRLYVRAMTLLTGEPMHDAHRHAQDYVRGSSKHIRGSNGSNRARIEHAKKLRQMAKASQRRNRVRA